MRHEALVYPSLSAGARAWSLRPVRLERRRKKGSLLISRARSPTGPLQLLEGKHSKFLL